MNQQLKNTFKKLEGKPVELAYNTHQPVPHTDGYNLYYMRGKLFLVGTDSFILEQSNKAVFYGDLDDVYYYSDLSMVNASPTSPTYPTSPTSTETPPPSSAPSQTPFDS